MSEREFSPWLYSTIRDTFTEVEPSSGVRVGILTYRQTKLYDAILAKLRKAPPPEAAEGARLPYVPADCDGCAVWRETANRLEARVRALETALKFYADPSTYLAIGFLSDPPCGDFLDDFSETDLGQKPGRRARAVLGDTP